MPGELCSSILRETSTSAPTCFGVMVTCSCCRSETVMALFSATQYAVADAFSRGIATLPTRPVSTRAPSRCRAQCISQNIDVLASQQIGGDDIRAGTGSRRGRRDRCALFKHGSREQHALCLGAAALLKLLRNFNLATGITCEFRSDARWLSAGNSLGIQSRTCGQDCRPAGRPFGVQSRPEFQRCE